MTQMSDQRSEISTSSNANRATARQVRAVARALHSRFVIRGVVFALMFTGCVFPPSLSVDTTDAALNAAPSITSVRADNTEFPELKTLVFEQGENAGTLVLGLYDTDAGDTLFARIFVDYNNPDRTPARSGCQSAASTVERTCTAEMNGVCQTADIGQTRVMQVIVFDRELLDFGEPLYQHMEPGGISASRTYFLRCQESSL